MARQGVYFDLVQSQQFVTSEDGPDSSEAHKPRTKTPSPLPPQPTELPGTEADTSVTSETAAAAALATPLATVPGAGSLSISSAAMDSTDNADNVEGTTAPQESARVLSLSGASFKEDVV